MSKTKENILDKALELYNLHGIEYVGVRELAKELDMKGGNITYYFPTKNDLIMELANRLSERNQEILAEERELTAYNFLDKHRILYRNQYKYRGLFISLPLLLKQNETFAGVYRQRQQERKSSIYNDLKSLFLKGYFQTAKSDDLDTIFNSIITTNRFWISESTVDNAIENEFTINTYLAHLAGLLNIIAAEKGKSEIRLFLAELRK